MYFVLSVDSIVSLTPPEDKEANLIRHFAFGINLLAIALFIPGIVLPMFSLDMSIMATVGSGASLSSELVNQQLSILQTVEELWQDKRIVVAILIFAFSICIPILKSSLVTLAYFTKSKKLQSRLLSLVTAVGKWSMADVFVVAVFLAVLSTNHADTQSVQQLTVFGFNLGVELSSQTLSNVGEGFYYFVGYCVLSLTGSQLFYFATNSQPQSKRLNTH